MNNRTKVKVQAEVHQVQEESANVGTSTEGEEAAESSINLRRLRSGASHERESKLFSLIKDNKQLDKQLVDLVNKFDNQISTSRHSELYTKTKLFRSHLHDFENYEFQLSSFPISTPENMINEDSHSSPKTDVETEKQIGRGNQSLGIDDSYLVSTLQGTMIQLVSNLIPIFNGEQNERLISELQAFLNCCRQVKSCLSPDQETSFCQLILTKLRGNAYLVMQNSKFSTLDEFEKLLRGYFMPRKTYIQLSNDLRQCRQFPTETLSSFLLRVQNLVAECKCSAGEQFPADAKALSTDSELAATYAIKSGVCNPIIRQYVLTSQETSLTKLCQTLLKLEMETNSTVPFQIGWPPYSCLTWPQSNLGQVSQTYQQSPYNNFPQNLSMSPYLQQHPSNSASPQNSTFQQNFPNVMYSHNAQREANKIVKCNFCGKFNHTYQECRKRLKQNAPFCINCREYGHNINTCSRNNIRQGQRFQNNNERSSVMVANSNQSQKPNKPNAKRCDFCLRVGHEISNCYTKKRWDEKNSANQKN